MREIIQRVLASEEEAKRLVANARTEAAATRSVARQRSQEILAQARQEARETGRRLIDEAVRKAEDEKKERLARATALAEERIRLDENLRREVVEAALRCVCARK